MMLLEELPNSNFIHIEERQSRTFAKITGNYHYIVNNWARYDSVKFLNGNCFIHHQIINSICSKARQENIRVVHRTLLDYKTKT